MQGKNSFSKETMICIAQWNIKFEKKTYKRFLDLVRKFFVISVN